MVEQQTPRKAAFPLSPVLLAKLTQSKKII